MELGGPADTDLAPCYCIQPWGIVATKVLSSTGLTVANKKWQGSTETVVKRVSCRWLR